MSVVPCTNDAHCQCRSGTNSERRPLCQQPAHDWVKATTLDELDVGPVIFKHGRFQIAIYQSAEQTYAIDNRCPHEGYPLAEGTIDEQCVLTCNWHNWKFRLDDGECLLGGDHVRAYETKVEMNDVYINLDPRSKQLIQSRVLQGLRAAFPKQDYGHICRELSRLYFNNRDPLEGVRQAIRWSFDKYEYGTTHAFAACADWLDLYRRYDGDWERQLVTLGETIDHMAFDALRHQEYPFLSGTDKWEETSFIEAAEQENRAIVETMVTNACATGVAFEEMEPAFTHAALAHYNDFGHTLIYVQKARSLLARSKMKSTQDILLPLARHICFTKREDITPEFCSYTHVFRECVKNFGNNLVMGDSSGLQKGGVEASLAWTAAAVEQYSPETIYDELLRVCGYNMLTFDLTHDSRTTNSVVDNVGWLGFTHAITFANAVREQCQQFSEFWKHGLLQLACFVGRNQRYRVLDMPTAEWRVDNWVDFLAKVHETILDSGIRAPIFVAHYLKTTLAIEAELACASSETQSMLLAALNRFVHSPIKQKHARRLAHQAIALIARDFE